MKRFCLISSAAAVSLLALAPNAKAEPAVLYIPTEEIELLPSGIVDTPCANVSTSEDNPGAGCIGGLAEATTRMPYAQAAMLTTDLAAAFDAFDIHVTNERPPAYLPHFMLMAGDSMNEMSESYTCTGSSFACAARGRNGVAFTYGTTMFCMDPDVTQASLYAVGRMSGLEGSSNAMDAMFYPPDSMMPATTFQDQCDPISPLLDAKMMPLQLECTSADHNGDCMAGEQNTVADLTAYFGARTEDADPPELTGSMPAADEDFPLPDGENTVEVVFSVAIADADPIVGLSWRIESDAFMATLGRNYLTACTNNHCDANLIEGDPFRPTDSEWSFPIGLPGGEYSVTLEASDYHGNAAEPIAYTFTVNGGVSTEESGSDTDMMTTGMTMTSSATTPTTMTTFLDTTDTEGESGDEESGNEDPAEEDGCGCTQSSGAGGAFMLILGLFGFAATRRRD